MGRIRIWNLEVCSWIRIRNKSFLIHNSALHYYPFVMPGTVLTFFLIAGIGAEQYYSFIIFVISLLLDPLVILPPVSCLVLSQKLIKTCVIQQEGQSNPLLSICIYSDTLVKNRPELSAKNTSQCNYSELCNFVCAFFISNYFLNIWWNFS